MQANPSGPTANEAPPLVMPYLGYQALRAQPGFVREPKSGRLVLARYADVAAALKHPGLSMRAVIGPVMNMPAYLQPVVRPAARMLSRMMLFTDPPDHTRLRSLAIKAFAPRAVEALRARIETIAEGLLDRLKGTGPVDVLEAYANWLPVLVIAEMLGASIHDHRRIKRWSDDWALLISSSTAPKAKVAVRGALSGYHLQRYLRKTIQRHRRHPGHDLLDEWISAEESGDRLKHDELVANALLLLVAGHITTTNLIASGTFLLLQHPDQLAQLRSDPSRMPSAVEEFLRYESPFQFSGRVAAEDVEVNGHTVPRGATLAICLGAANRDPEQFPDPNRLDITRSDNRHLAFGAGIHFCLGAALARLEGQVAIGVLLRRFPNLRMAAEPVEWRNAGVLRGLKALPVFTR